MISLKLLSNSHFIPDLHQDALRETITYSVVKVILKVQEVIGS